MGHFLDGLIGWSIDNRAVVLLGAVALVVGGLWATSRASLDALPDFTPPRVVVQTEATGMGTTDVEQLVTEPLERVLLGPPESTSVRSTSSPGLSVIVLMFADGLDIFRARQLVTERLQLAGAHLPTLVHAPQLAPIAAPIGALLKFCLTSDDTDPQRAARELRTFAEWTLRPRLLAISGVAQVTAHGGDVERVEVRPDPVRIRQRGVTLADVTEAVRTSQALAGAGFVEIGAARLDVQNDARLTIGDATTILQALPVGTPKNSPVRLGDVADVVESAEPPVGSAIYDGRPAVYLQVTKLPWADTLGVTTKVERALHDLARELPKGALV